MQISRLYTGDDLQTHIEWITIEDHPELADPRTAESIFFRVTAPGHFIDWHTAPRRQYVITLQGEVEIGLGDGSVHRFGAGHVTLADDLTGQGHTTRVVGNRARITATVPID